MSALRRWALLGGWEGGGGGRVDPLRVLCGWQGVLDFDYAPVSILVSKGAYSRRVWMNITQEGNGAVDDLREKGMLNGLKARLGPRIFISFDVMSCDAI